MEVYLRPLSFMKFLQNNNHPADNKMKLIENHSQKPLGLFRNLYMCLCVGGI